MDSAPPSAEASAAPEVRRLGRAGIAWRVAVLLIGTVLIVRGTLFGNDVDWPFGPMSQYAFRIGTNGEIRSTFLEARSADGRVTQVPITTGSVGVARAQIEGQQPAIVRDPSLLSALAGGYHRLNPGKPALTQLWLAEDVTRLHNGRDVGHSTDTLVGWPVNDTAPDVPK